MPFEITLNHFPAGYALNSARPGGTVDVAVRGFTSFEDGELFISRLEGIPVEILQRLPASANADASVTHSLFAILRADRTATVYYNEFSPTLLMRTKRPIQKGEFVFLDDVLDIDRSELGELEIPENAGICYVFSQGWRKGYFFDFGPAHEGSQYRRDYNLGVVIGQCHAHLMFQHLFSMSEEVFGELLKQDWFPFAHLPTQRVKTMIARAKEKLPIDDELASIRDEAISAAETRVQTWAANPILAPHTAFFATALERLKSGDYISANSILYPRLEGVMRDYHVSLRPDNPTQITMATVASGDGHSAFRESSLFLPTKFRRYLTEVYFSHFDPNLAATKVSRNTVSHGVAPAELFNEKAAVIGVLIALQIASVIGATSKNPKN